MKRPLQRIVIIVVALMLVIPIGAIGIGQLLGPGPDDAGPQETADPADERPTVDPADQPPRPELEPPAEPAAMTEQSAAGAEATLTYLLESYTFMMSSGDTSVWEDSVDPSCEVCVSFLSNAELLDEQGGYLVDGEFTVHDATFEAADDAEPPTEGTVTADFEQAASTLVDDPTRAAYELESVTGQLMAEVTWDGERWLVTDMSIAPEEGAEPPEDGVDG